MQIPQARYSPHSTTLAQLALQRANQVSPRQADQIQLRCLQDIVESPESTGFERSLAGLGQTMAKEVEEYDNDWRPLHWASFGKIPPYHQGAAAARQAACQVLAAASPGPAAAVMVQFLAQADQMCQEDRKDMLARTGLSQLAQNDNLEPTDCHILGLVAQEQRNGRISMDRAAIPLEQALRDCGSKSFEARVAGFYAAASETKSNEYLARSGLHHLLNNPTASEACRELATEALEAKGCDPITAVRAQKNALLLIAQGKPTRVEEQKLPLAWQRVNQPEPTRALLQQISQDLKALGPSQEEQVERAQLLQLQGLLENRLADEQNQAALERSRATRKAALEHLEQPSPEPNYLLAAEIELGQQRLGLD